MHWLEDCAILRQRRRKTTNTASLLPSTLSEIQAASQSTMYNYTPIVTDKNKQLTLLNKHKLTKPREIHFLRYKIIEST